MLFQGSQLPLELMVNRTILWGEGDRDDDPSLGTIWHHVSSTVWQLCKL